MSLGDERSDGSADEHLGFASPKPIREEPSTTGETPHELDDEDAYVDSWYQVLKMRATETDGV